jgi:pimeloyl-ACP methyl ester carboxylesterase
MSLSFGPIVQLIREFGPNKGLELFKQSEDYRAIMRESPNAAESLAKQFQQSRAEETVVKLERIPSDVPSGDRREWAFIQKPTLVLANYHDPIHPFEYGEILAQTIPGAVWKQITSKSVSTERHAADVQQAIEEFLRCHFLRVEIPTS